jgi:hypothetical protein
MSAAVATFAPSTMSSLLSVCESWPYQFAQLQCQTGKYINKDKFHNKFEDMGQQFEERRRNLEMVLLLAASARLATDPAPPPADVSTDSIISSSTRINLPQNVSVEVIRVFSCSFKWLNGRFNRVISTSSRSLLRPRVPSAMKWVW